MKAAVCYEFGKPLVVEDVELAEPGKGDVKIRLAATAICHSDIHDMKGRDARAGAFCRRARIGRLYR